MVTKDRPGKALPATISAAEFKAKCLDIMNSVSQTGKSVVVTKRGKPVAVLSPVRAPRQSAFGLLKGRIKIIGDIVSPIDVEWDAEK